MLDKVRNTINKYGFLENGDKVLIGLSGGADSVCLTHVLHRLKDELGICLYTAHMNHCLRGEHADGDEKFAVEFSEKLGIQCITKREDVKAYAEKNGISEEMAGRELRYAFFECVRKDYGLNKIATAHNKNDNAETILMNFIRGSGISGLCGIPYRRGEIIRPIIEISREEIEEYCSENGLSYVTDSTNCEMIYTRNKIRLDLIPKIRNDFNPGFITTVTKNAGLMSEELDYIENQADLVYGKVKDGVILLEDLNCHIAIKRRVILKMLKSSGINDVSADYVEAVLRLIDTGHSGLRISLPGENTAELEYGRLFIGKIPDKVQPFEYPVSIGKEVYIREMDIAVKAEYAVGNDVFRADKDSKILVRSRRDGDYFYPVGMQGKKKLKNYFIDNKIPRSERDRTGILTIDNEIAWIIGKRRDRRFVSNGAGIRIKLLK